MRRRTIDPPRSFWSVVVTPDNGADLNYIADRIAKLAGVNTMIEERRITALWQEDENGGGGGRSAQ